MQGPDIVIEPFALFGGIVGLSDGHGIFVDCGGYRMNVGAILPHPEGRYLLNVMVLAEMGVPGYAPCDLSEVCDSFEEASEKALRFLASQRAEK